MTFNELIKKIDFKFFPHIVMDICSDEEYEQLEKDYFDVCNEIKALGDNLTMDDRDMAMELYMKRERAAMAMGSASMARLSDEEHEKMIEEFFKNDYAKLKRILGI